MKKVLFILILSLIIISIIPAAARTFEFDFGDESIWEDIEETYNEGQLDREAGHVRSDGGFSVGWFKPGNALEVLDKVDFGNGLVSMTASNAAAFPEGFFAGNMPDAVFEIRIDTYDGPVVATIKPEGSDGWSIEVDSVCTITDIGKETKGEHTIFLVNKIGTPEEYVSGSVKGSSNFCKLTLETSATEPTPSPTPEPTEVPVTTATPVPTVKPTATPVAKDDNSSNIAPYLGLAAAVIVVVIVVSIVVIKKKKK